MGLGKSSIHDLSATNILVPDGFTRALGAPGE
jgi:pre-mycofactocin synthase